MRRINIDIITALCLAFFSPVNAYCIEAEPVPTEQATQAPPTPTPTPPYGDCKYDKDSKSCKSEGEGCPPIQGQTVKCCRVKMYCGEFGVWVETDSACMCFNKTSLAYFCKNAKKTPRVKCRYTTDCGEGESDKMMCPKPAPEPIPGGGLTY